MPDTVTALQGQTVTPSISEFYARPEEATQSNAIDKDTFLKLLVAQLKYQDPLEPSSSEDFIATTAQFTTVEKLDELTKQGQNTALVNALTTASSLVGRTITVNDGEGVPIETVVERSQLIGGEVALITGLGTIGLNQIVSIGMPSGGLSPAASPATTAVPAPPSTPDTVTDDDVDTTILEIPS